MSYDTYIAACTICRPKSHIITTVKNLSFAGSKHLVDVNGYPSFEAIPLDFEHESPIYYHEFLEYNVDGWRRLCEVDLTPRDLF